MMNGNDVVPKGTPKSKPYLILNWLDEEQAKRFIEPICYEVSELTKGGMEIIYEGTLDHKNPSDRKNLAELASWCYSMGYALTTYKQRVGHDVQRVSVLQSNGRSVDEGSGSNRKDN